MSDNLRMFEMLKSLSMDVKFVFEVLFFCSSQTYCGHGVHNNTVNEVYINTN